MKLRPKLCIASSMPQQSIGSTARTLSSTDTDRNPRQTGCPQLVTSYDTQEDTLGLFYIPGPTGGEELEEFESSYSCCLCKRKKIRNLQSCWEVSVQGKDSDSVLRIENIVWLHCNDCRKFYHLACIRG